MFIFVLCIFLFVILLECSFRCNHLFSHEVQGWNVLDSLTVGCVFIAYMFQSHKQWEVAFPILVNTSALIKFKIENWTAG